MPPPFNIDETSPAPTDIISGFPADEQSNRAEIEEWLTYISDPTTGMLRANRYFAAGTRMVFNQTSAPTGWTKDATKDQHALRIVSGAVGSGGTVDFTTAFASQSVAGTVGDTALSTAQLPSHTHGVGSIAAASAGSHSHIVAGSTDAQGTHSHTITSGTVAIMTGFVPLSNFLGRGNQGGGLSSTSTTIDAAGSHAHNVSGGTDAQGTHSHTMSGATAAAGSGATHTHTFSGTAINLAVKYVDMIIAQVDA